MFDGYRGGGERGSKGLWLYMTRERGEGERKVMVGEQNMWNTRFACGEILHVGVGRDSAGGGRGETS